MCSANICCLGNIWETDTTKKASGVQNVTHSVHSYWQLENWETQKKLFHIFTCEKLTWIQQDRIKKEERQKTRLSSYFSPSLTGCQLTKNKWETAGDLKSFFKNLTWKTIQLKKERRQHICLIEVWLMRPRGTIWHLPLQLVTVNL